MIREIYNDNSNPWPEWGKIIINEIKLEPLYVDEIPENTVPYRRGFSYAYRCDDPNNHAVMRFRKTKVIIMAIYVNKNLIATNVTFPFTNDSEWNYNNLPIYRTKEGLQCGNSIIVKCGALDSLDLVNMCIG